MRNVSTTDGAFEVILGQGRLLTLKADLGVPGGHKPLLAIGDPTIAEFLLVGPRQIRVLGLRLGVTDLVITAPDGQTSYTFEVTVTADLDALRARLQCLFPDASLKLGQVRDHIVVEGEARDSAQVTRILELIRAYLASLEAEQRRRAYMQMGAGAVVLCLVHNRQDRTARPRWRPTHLGQVSRAWESAGVRVRTPCLAPRSST